MSLLNTDVVGTSQPASDVQPSTSEVPQQSAAPEAPEDSSAEQVEAVPTLSDEDYQLNFLGSDKFELARDTPEEVRASLKNLEHSLNKGWTEKNMKLAERERQRQTEWQQAQEDITLNRALVKEAAKVESLQSQIAEYDSVNWQLWAQQDANAANQGFMHLESLKQRKAKLESEVSEKQRDAQAKFQERMTAFLSEADQKLSTKIRDWGDDKRSSLRKFVSDSYLNTSPQADSAAAQVLTWHPGLIEMAHDAMLYRQSLEKARAPAAPPKVTPVTKVGGAAQAAVDPERMTDDEWMKWRRSQVSRAHSNQNLKQNRR